MQFDPNSPDAMFAKVLTKLEEQAALLSEIRENGRQTEKEIAGLISWKNNMEGRIAVLSLFISAAAAFAVSYFTKK